METFARGVDRLNEFVAKAFAWSILALTFALGYEVISRYLFGRPTDWAFDASYILYGILFMMAAPYTLSIGGHVRGDMLYRLWPPRTQATIDLILYLVLFFPPMVAMLYLGWDYAHYAYWIGERSASSPEGPIIWPLKMVIPITAFLMLLQGVAQVMRAARAIKRGSWE